MPRNQRRDSVEYADDGFYKTVDVTSRLKAGQPATIGALYHYYSNKEALLIAVTEDALQRAVAVAKEAADLDADPAARLANLVRAHVREQGTDAELWNTSAREMPRTDANGNWTPVPRLSLLAMCNGISDWYQPAGRLSLDELADLMAEMALDLVQSRRG